MRLLLASLLLASGALADDEVLLEPSDQIFTDLVDEITGAEGGGGPVPLRDPNRWPLSLINATAYWETEGLKAEGSVEDAAEAEEWVEGYLREAEQIFQIAAEAGWEYFTDIAHERREALVDAEEVLGRFLKASSAQARQFDLPSLSGNASLARLLRMVGMEGLTALPDQDFRLLSALQRDVAENFTLGAVCEDGELPPNCALNWPAVQGLMATSRDPATLRRAWEAWHAAVGPHVRPHYQQVIALSNKGARLNGFRDAGELWRSPFEEHAPSSGQDPLVSLPDELERVWQQVLPLYQQLHAFVRRKLAALYAPGALSDFAKDGPIPAQFLGSMSSDTWLALFSDLAPYPSLHPAFAAPSAQQLGPNPNSPFADPFAPPPDRLTQSLYAREYTPPQMFKDAEAFFVSLGFPKLPASFWEKSVLEHPITRDVFCHPPTAFDLKDGEHFLVKMCAEVGREDYVEAHRLLAHTFYQRSYSAQPLTFREAANPAMSQAVASAVGKYVASPGHLRSAGLLPPPEPPTEAEPGAEADSLSREEKVRVNELLEEALEWLVSGADALAIDAWRWGAFDGSVPLEGLNGGWWAKRLRYQGIRPPSPRTEEFFDPASNPQVATQQFPAVKRFLAYVLHFQLLKALCSAAGAQGPLDLATCRLSNSTLAGDRLRDLMRPGISRPWTQVLKDAVGSDRLDATPLLEHYAPLMEWLRAKNAETEEHIGWDGPGKPFGSDVLDGARPASAASPSGGTGEVALPGQPCTRGQFCILDSACNGTVCECKEGFFPFTDSDAETGDLSVHCVLAGEDFGDFFPADGFQGGLEIEGEEIPYPEEEPIDQAKPRTPLRRPSSAPALFSSPLALITAALIPLALLR